ncbi:MAG: hypothetical protein WC373_04605 [Smithella sp.]
MRVAINAQCYRGVRNYTSCGAHRFGWNAHYRRLNLWPISCWFGPGKGLALGDCAYYKSYADCPSAWARICRWIGYKTGAYPTVSRPYKE